MVYVKEKGLREKKLYIIGLCAITLVLVGILGTYAYFTSVIINDNRQEAEVDMGTLSLRFADNDNGINARLTFGESITKKFTLENTGTLDATVSIEWLDMINTYTEGSLTYTLFYSESENGDYSEVISSKNVPTSSTEFTSTLVPDITIPVGKTYYYNLVVTLNYSDTIDQTSDINAVFSTKFDIQQSSKIRKYTLTVDPNGGTIDGSSEIQTFNLSAGDEQNISIPLSLDSDFIEWEISGYDSTINDSTVVMGKSNTKIVAKYKAGQAREVLEYLKVVPNENYPKSFTVEATKNEGVFRAQDDYGTSYYYRGAVDNNYVKFAGFYWRIVRINGNGSVRMIYDGTTAHPNGENNTDRFTHLKQVWNDFQDDAKYMGYMFGGENGVASASLEESVRNETNSSIKSVVDDWYKTNIVDRDYDRYVSDTLFCNDRTLDESTGNTVGYGVGESWTMGRSRYRANMYGQVRLTCPQKNDAFTVGDTERGNGSLTYPIGLLTVDEKMMAGLYNVNYSNYLYKGNKYWSMTPDSLHQSKANIILVGDHPYIFVKATSVHVAPVINLKPEYVKTMIGSGTIDDPFRTVDNR